MVVFFLASAYAAGAEITAGFCARDEWGVQEDADLREKGGERNDETDLKWLRNHSVGMNWIELIWIGYGVNEEYEGTLQYGRYM